MNGDEDKPAPAASDQYIAEMVADVKSALKPSPTPFTDEQIEKACREVMTCIGEMELVSMLQIQDQFCDRCATCCKVCDPIQMSGAEMDRIFAKLGLRSKEGMKKFNITWSGRGDYYNMKGGPCPFLKEPNICTVYEVRPDVCSGFPVTSMVADAMESKPVTHFDYCHVMKKLNASRARVKLLHDNVPELREKLSGFEPALKAFAKQLNAEPDPAKRLRMQYQLMQRLTRMAEGQDGAT